jgi:nitrogen fixation/metabolism regulation signal transduction histidine kinase
MSQSDRKKKYIDPKVQGALVQRLVLHWLAFIAVASVVAFVLQVLADPLRPMSEHFQQLWWTHGPFLLVMVFLLPVFVLDTIKLSHRFAGPIYRLRQTIRHIAEGNPAPRLKFRDFDFWHGLAEDFNRMVDRLSTHDVGVLDYEDDSVPDGKQVSSTPEAK